MLRVSPLMLNQSEMTELFPGGRDAPIKVDIVSDVVCPWCVIAYHQLAAAAEIIGLDLAVRWHPFELNPQMAGEGENLREHLAAKYGTTPEGSREARKRLTAMGAEVGFTFNYADDMRMWNTFRAHQLVDWASQFGAAHHAVLALFSAFFTHRRSVHEVETLSGIARDLGLDENEAQRVIENEERALGVRERESYWTKRGIQSVPTMIFQDKYLVSGAQGVERYRLILEQSQGNQPA